MKKMLPFLLLVLLVVPLNLQARITYTEMVSIPLPKFLSKWKIGFQDFTTKDSSTVRYILEDQTIETWTELVNVQYKAHKLVKCADAVEAMRNEIILNERVIFKIHSQAPNDLIFEKIFPSGMHEIVRMIMTDKGLHRVAYTKRDGPFTEADRSQWIERLANATVSITHTRH